MTMTVSRNAEDILARASEFVPRLRAEARRIDDERRLPADLVEAMKEAGFFHTQVPFDYGGLQLDPLATGRMVEELSRGDGSAGWCAMLASQSAVFAGLFDPHAALEIWGNGGIVAGVGRPIGKAVRAPSGDGYVVSGRWPFASGSSHADWFGGECIVQEDGVPKLLPNGEPDTILTLMPREQVAVIDTWDTLGLRGTASNDFAADGVLVPDARVARYSDAPQHEWAVYRVLPLFAMGHATHALGVAQGALDAAIELVQTKRGWGNVPIRELPRAQAGIAEATGLIDAARTHLYAKAGQLWDLAVAGGDDPRLRAEVRLATSHAGSSALRAVDLLHALLATSAIAKANPLERCFRDIHTAMAHVMIGPLTFEAAGRALLGMEVNFPFF